MVSFAVPLWRMALAFERLAEGELPGASRALGAMRTLPELFGGPDSADTRLMVSLPGTVAERGAEGLLCGALADGSGFALKTEDGAQRPLVAAAARLLGVAELLEEPVANSRGELVGSLRAR